ncbi:MAG TPA: phosphatidate cytidylyltransferase [bacterium]|nr:phosphatidate cytidylyltransferase [bacterium]HPQ66155.1 phosphatidate cytidylyltransferase [bacterium]
MLRHRLQTAGILIAVLLGVVLLSYRVPVLFFLVGNFFVILGCLEFAQLTGGIRWTAAVGGGLVFSSAFIAAVGPRYIPSQFVVFCQPEWPEFSLLVLLVLTFLFQATRRELDGAAARICSTVTAVIYASWLMSFLPRINYYQSFRFPDLDGRMYLFFLFFVVKVTDSAAYFVGSKWGRRKLIPRLSPRKTLEGAVAGIVFGGVAALGGKYLFALNEVSAAGVTTLGLLLGGTSIGADLAESLIKRSAGEKDSGNTLPGLGGVLDLMDSVYFSAPVLFFYMKLVFKL